MIEMESRATRTVLLTGASSGIGQAIYHRLVQQQYRVIAVGRNVAQLEKHKLLQTVNLDLSDPESVSPAISALIKEWEQQSTPIDSFVACAGYGQFGCLEQFSVAQIRDLLDVNFTSQALIVRALIPELKRRRYGDIIFMGSEAALSGARNGAMYCASKFALRGFAQALREESSKSGVRVGIINPGMVKTPFFDELGFAPGDEEVQHIRAADVADAVMLMLNQPRGTVIDEINMSPLNKVVRNKSE